MKHSVKTQTRRNVPEQMIRGCEGDVRAVCSCGWHSGWRNVFDPNQYSATAKAAHQHVQSH